MTLPSLLAWCHWCHGVGSIIVNIIIPVLQCIGRHSASIIMASVSWHLHCWCHGIMTSLSVLTSLPASQHHCCHLHHSIITSIGIIAIMTALLLTLALLSASWFCFFCMHHCVIASVSIVTSIMLLLLAFVLQLAS